MTRVVKPGANISGIDIPGLGVPGLDIPGQEIPGVTLTELAPGYPVLTLQHNALSASVSLYGGQLLSCRHGDQDWLWPNPALQVRPGKALRAGVPVCWPWFGTLDSALPAHGFVRTRHWSVASLQRSESALTLTLALQDDEASRQLWPHRFHLQLQIRISTVLSVQLLMQNTDDHAYPVAGALHSYFSVTDIADTTIAGLEGCDYYDQLTSQTLSQRGIVGFSQETDRIYHAGDNRLQIESKEKRLLLQQHCNTDTVVWTPWTEKAARLGDVVGDDWRHFVCAETAIANDHAVILAPKAHYAIGFTLTGPGAEASEQHGRT
ncbi:D-hexose-6-phosphate mutarotase [Permianibacter sp. IMCC34836]|uniref:D-hexose-6-phosphate mutarotase n=1 Tax=Permianibacter fluminis TaxID=2738515 RepID=UPI0015527743|nr:D-hexose-6-phosphate mutarotase [Permianibacter fluminis]NQD37383.1 D-hexose-6-phosphate mutarotase [Permianibacter fluminis]